jgi:hypothetical protein
MYASVRTENGMKTYSFITNRKKTTHEAGSVAKVTLGVVAVAVVGTAGFMLYAKGKPLSENPLAQITQTIQSTVSDAKTETKKAETTPGDAPEAAPVSTAAATQDSPPSAAAAPSVAAASTPVPVRVAPDGMVFLARRVTISRDSGISSYPEGTLLLVKSKAGGKIKGSINGVAIEVSASDTATTFRQ